MDERNQIYATSPTIEPSDETVIPSPIEDLKSAVAQHAGMDFPMFPGQNITPVAIEDHNIKMGFTFDPHERMTSSTLDMLLSFDALIGIESIPFEYLSEMYQNYFTTTHQTFPLINQEAFLSSLSINGNAQEVLALQSAMCAHVAAVSPNFMSWAVLNLAFVGDQDYGHWFYQHSKLHLSKAETENQITPSLATLQASALIGLYELKQSQFSQAWVTISRAVWEAQCLRHPKTESLHPSQQRIPLPTPPPTPKGRSLNSNEERNAVWAVIHLNCFLGIGVSSNVIDTVAQNEMGVYLPCQDELDMDLRLEEVMKATHQAFQLSIKQHLSIATILCARTFSHIKMMKHASSLDHNPYNFWTQHYHLDEATRHIGCCISGSVHGSTDTREDVNCRIVVNLLLKTITICLHEAFMHKAESEVSMKGSFKHARQAQSSHALTLQNCMDITELVQSIVSTDEAKSSIFLPWSIYVAIQSLVRHQRRATSPAVLIQPTSQSFTNSDDTTAFSGGNCLRCATASQSSSLEQEDKAGLLAEAVVLDAINALRSSLVHLSHQMPLARFFYDEAQVEAQVEAHGTDELVDRVVGLAAFTNFE
ncbi:hypothetical protein Aspvir_000004 [Aspergillus viridinutans]|uniref:Xylanolytic transcriptional activator regulatory domain-containing protein n=1 Tax=Aspergillus viridinutans TaxID=75553 RepID=A0A9P3EY89_ASPVI|nr:uncharacterized protein Aspvir_000004 [Aspergillus viridinutans]GIJ97898.1 hypothetical protein Aspvir_000004 [Aspergillus viridinutans]